MTANIPTTIHRADYRPLAWLVTDIDLKFALDPSSTLVTSRLTLKRNPQVANGPLMLLGDELELVSLTVDGREPAAPRVTPARIEIDLSGDSASVEIVTRISPEKNTALSGLYTSRGGLFTQCEAEGFRRITWFPDRPDVMARFTVLLEAERTKYPVLLSNGNLVDQGELPDGRHFARWEDPFPKPCYLFALVAGDLAVNERRIDTASGREVLLQIWTEAAALDRTEHAMDSLVRAIRWDEQRFGLELDLERFMVVAVSDFNMGAMENKGLNIFNSKLLLATPDTATDVDYENIEAVVAHEYFHNWTGNRVTCRDWFQLTLKEGLTVFRDQEFTADMLAGMVADAGGDSARAVKRIDDVRVLRAAQFPEDAGPMAHPIRPDSYQEINNFYTATVYEKGAEVIRMLQTLLGRDGFRKGMDLYFKRHDGQAVTCDDFVAAMADANNRDLTQFLRWYSRPGTPVLKAEGRYDAAAKTYTLTLAQASQDKPLPIPVAVGLIGADGRDLPDSNRLLELDAAEKNWTFDNIGERPVLSLLRGFSAPVIVEFIGSTEDDTTLAFRMAHDSDPFNRWDAAQRFMERTVLALADNAAAGKPLQTPEAFVAAFGKLLADDTIDPAYRAQALALPGETYLLERMGMATAGADPAALRTALKHLLRDLGTRFWADWQDCHAACRVTGDYRYHPADIGQRALANLCLRYLCAAGGNAGYAAAAAQFDGANNMSECLGALGALANSASPEREAAIAAFHLRYADDTLVLDKWFAIQAGAWRWATDAPPTLARVKALLAHPGFAATNPNKVYALLGTFFRANPGEFHTPDGHAFWTEQIVALDAINPQVAARMARALERWRSFTPALQESMQAALVSLAGTGRLSADVAEIVGKALQ